MGSCPTKHEDASTTEFVKITRTIKLPSKTSPTITSEPPTPEVVAQQISWSIDEKLVRDRRRREKTMKLLFLGPSESGKSTVLKQLKIINTNGYSKGELLAQRDAIYQNIVQSLHQLIEGLNQLGFDVPPSREACFHTVVSISRLTSEAFDDTLCAAMKAIWSLKVVQEAYERRSEFQLLDCAKYFLDNIDRIQRFDYCPTTEDILNARVVTLGVNELCYTYGDKEFRIVDVGGQRSERRKWINFFDNVNAIFFVAAISEFDQLMYEDDETNRLEDAMDLFREVGNNPIFEDAHIILFLNKIDLFEEKLKRVRLGAYFPKYRFKNDMKNTTKYIIKKFEKQILDKKKTIYPHLTCAKDTQQIQFLTNSLSDMIIARALKRVGAN